MCFFFSSFKLLFFGNESLYWMEMKFHELWSPFNSKIVVYVWVCVCVTVSLFIFYTYSSQFEHAQWVNRIVCTDWICPQKRRWKEDKSKPQNPLFLFHRERIKQKLRRILWMCIIGVFLNLRSIHLFNRISDSQQWTKNEKEKSNSLIEFCLFLWQCVYMFLLSFVILFFFAPYTHTPYHTYCIVDRLAYQSRNWSVETCTKLGFQKS